MPDAAKANTKAGAVAFVKYYIELINHAQATGDLDDLAALEGQRCESCRQVRDYLEGIYSSGGSVSGGEWRVQRAEARPGTDPGTWVIDVIGTFAPSTVMPSPGASPRAATGGPAPSTFFVQRSAGWVVTKWTRGI
jgi:hypothetical protein